MKLRELIKECFTDTRGRPEVKMALGVPLILFSVAYLLWKKDLQGSIYIGGLGTTLVGGTAICDSFNDSHPIPPGM
jgi:hypothetical protein